MEENVVIEDYALFKREFGGNSNLYNFYDKLNDNLVYNIDKRQGICYDAKKDLEIMKLCGSLEKIIKVWESICTVNENEKYTCFDYLSYWLYDKIIERNFHIHNIIWIYDKFESLLTASNIINVEKIKISKIYDINALKKKRRLLNFLLHYDRIKNKLQDTSNENKRNYCNYIYYIFELYKEIENKASVGLCRKEVDEFKEKFNSVNNKELNFINEKCPGKCLDYVFKAKNKNFCNLKEHKESDSYMPRIFPIAKTYNISDEIKKLKEEKNDAFKELPSSRIYNELNKKIEDSSTSSASRCDKLSTKSEVTDLCKKIERNLNNLSTNVELKYESHSDRCLYFNYWVHDELRTMFNGKTEDEYPNKTDIDKLLDEWYHISDGLMKGDFNENYEKIRNNYSTMNNNVSRGTQTYSNPSGNVPPIPQKIYRITDFSKHKACFYNSDCTFYDCDDMKVLYDYFKNHYTIENKIKSNNGSQCKIYYEYVSYIKPIYDKYYDVCCNVWPCSYFNCNDKYDLDDLLTKLKNCSENKSVSTPSTTRSKGRKSAVLYHINNTKRYSWVSAFGNTTGYKYFRCYGKNNTDTNLLEMASCYEVKTSNKESFEKVFDVAQSGTRSNSNVSFLGRTISKENNTYSSPMQENKKVLGVEEAEIRSNSKVNFSGITISEENNTDTLSISDEVFDVEEEKIRPNSNDSFSGESTSEESNTYTPLIPEDTCDTIFCDTFRIGSLGVLMVGTILIFFLYYKFTPLGQRLGNIIFCKKSVKRNFYEEVRNSSPKCDSKRRNKNMNQKRIRIAYVAQEGNR